MTRVLVVKLLRDVRLQLAIVALLLAGFECLWTRITQRITMELLPDLRAKMTFNDYLALMRLIFQGPGELMKTLIGGESIDITVPLHVLTIGYVHPLLQTILCIWAIGRSAGALTGEIDRGTMELLLAQPIPRWRVIFAHLCVDLICIVLLCLSVWAGTCLGIFLFGEVDLGQVASSDRMTIDPRVLLPALPNMAALLFAISGCTIALSAFGRFRGRVLGLAVLLILVQFIVNIIGQMWTTIGFLRPLTVFFYYQPQQIILSHRWNIDLAGPWQLSRPLTVNGVVVLTAIGIVGYAAALHIFCRRDIPAPL